DAERPLSPQGAARARKAALGLKRITPRPARVLVSPLRRARQTAAILTRFAGWPEARKCVQLLPGASPQGVLALLARTRGRRRATAAPATPERSARGTAAPTHRRCRSRTA